MYQLTITQPGYNTIRFDLAEKSDIGKFFDILMPYLEQHGTSILLRQITA